ncbi:EamA family transporter RarD [Rhizobium sp. NTR19]|uniref:EamA family transporter RarD n=1 Tax=Neorhizobium turbinariae TaxID=2937795 RepID=A0ABT0IUY4_9HYPH|nr:EamA family transporter RarD [Neorhizobium turbinariae]MCK8781655.1 EamA family transporter RarD [Neorhizobium turbinariae]
MSAQPDTPVAKNEDTPRGFVLGMMAYGLWGFLPLYLKSIAHIPALEVLAHRAIWSVPVAGVVLLILRRFGDLKRAIQTPRMLGMACLTAFIIMVNWGIYVWAVATDRALDAALGYFLNPLFSIFLAAVLLKEKLSPRQLAAIGLVVIAVAILTLDAGGLPWISIGLCVTWGFYALLRKTLPIGPNQGFFLEVLLISIPALPYVLWLESTGEGHILNGTGMETLLLMMAGVVTATPLMIYANAAKLLRLSTIGIMQYIAPTMIFLIAVLVFHEPLSQIKLTAFVLIWLALALYTSAMLSQARGAKTA